MRERLLELPDGEFRAVDFLEHDGHTDRTYRIDLRMTKSGDGLVMDFSGSSEQAPGFVNCTRAGLTGGGRGHDPADARLRHAVERGRAATGRDRRARRADRARRMPPAPVGAATVESVWLTASVVSAAVNKLLACSLGLSRRVPRR